MSSTGRLHDMTAVITGGGGGIGRATAALLVDDGAHVLISGRTQSKLDAVVERLQPRAQAAGGTVRALSGDALDEGDVERMVAAASEPTGRIDMAVAVVGSGPMVPVLRQTVQQLEDCMRTNITSAYLLLRHAGSAMVRQGGGSFVSVSSMQAVQSAPMLSAYCAAKAGLEMFCKVAADELGKHRVRVNVVRPGLTATDTTVRMMGDADVMAAYMTQQPIDRPGEADDIAHAIRYFLGPESAWTTGQCLSIDGGTTLRRFPDLDGYYRSRLGDTVERAERGEL